MTLEAAKALLNETIRRNGQVTVLSGAGISAESGIPTFRGPEGFWTVGSRQYHPQEMATAAMFNRDPESVWVWYLYRWGLCRRARPNDGHRAVAAMEKGLGDRFALITQNVDGLHIRAGSSLQRTFQIHGNIFYTRCASACTDDILALPAGLGDKQKGGFLTDPERRRLKCRDCGSWLRPHVLWFDESYNERHYHFRSALKTADRTRLLITVGTTGTTTLPSYVVERVLRGGGLMIDINVADNPFADLAIKSGRGIAVRRRSSHTLTELVRAADLTWLNL
ncbi:MAG TPA: Sir2 family NAD-dependent protein deacetylase [Desulfosarcina sp.]|nr:Sir2 family NAD-dependent protein deacetylase [Desulfosarcina sp.]